MMTPDGRVRNQTECRRTRDQPSRPRSMLKSHCAITSNLDVDRLARIIRHYGNTERHEALRLGSQ